MKTISVLMALFSMTFAVHANEEEISADAIVGIWTTEKADAHVEIVKEPDETYSATIIWLKDPFFSPDDEDGMAGQPKVDRENPDPELRDRPIEGLQIMHGMVHDEGRNWSDGEIYDPESGKTYSSRIRLTDRGTLRVRGYVGIPLFGRTTEWTPVLMNETSPDLITDEIEKDQATQDVSDEKKENGQEESDSIQLETESEGDNGSGDTPGKTLPR